MLQDSDSFKELFVLPHAKILTADIMSTFQPFLNDPLLHEEELRKCLDDLFCDAIELRASYFPDPGTRYELIQYKPGTTYNSRMMEVQPIPVENWRVQPNAETPLRIKLCVHGSIITHTVKENPSAGFDRIRDWSQSFIEKSAGKDCDEIPSTVKLASQRAKVILDEDVSKYY